MSEILIFKWFLQNSNKFQKNRFGKGKLVEDVITLGPMAQATLVFIIGYPHTKWGSYIYNTKQWNYHSNMDNV
jgi:hypothetical protein